ncbi:MAG: hypothetical protein QRY71_01560 [Candidatus Rhabdochlamydia sp.]
MLIRNILQRVGKHTSLFLIPKETNGKFATVFFSTTVTKATEVASSKLGSTTSHSTQIQESTLYTAPHPKLQNEPLKNLSFQENQAKPILLREAPWLRPLIEKGVIDAEAERKFLASLEPEWVSNPKDFVQIDLNKATYDDLIDILPLTVRDIVDPEVEKKITKICDDQMNADFAIEYANPELDRLIELNHGRIENIEDFDIFELEHRASLGLLDEETARKSQERLFAYYDKMSQDLIDEGELTDYSAYLEEELEGELNPLEK